MFALFGTPRKPLQPINDKRNVSRVRAPTVLLPRKDQIEMMSLKKETNRKTDQ